MICKIFISIVSIMLTVSFGQVGKVSFNKARLVPKMLNYQGYLTDTLGSPVTDNLDMTFKIFDAVSSGNELWFETQTNVPIERGVFSVILGETTPIPDSVFADFTSTWLELTLEGPQTMTPRTRITSVGYAYTSTYSDTAEYARNAAADNDWSVTDSVLYTGNYWGIARGGAGNTLYGDSAHTHTNLGVNSRTGVSGLHHYYCTVGGGITNIVSMRNATVGGGRYNVASGDAATIAGGNTNTASEQSATISGGTLNSASGYYATVSGGANNTASSWDATVGGGWENTASAVAATIAGGYDNFVEGEYSAILGGYADTIFATADYSYLFGIASKLTEDSTFMVDMPHIRFGDETNGYEFPIADGSADQVMVTDGSGQMSWGNGSSFGSWSVTDSVLYTNNYWGIARGGANNMLYGSNVHTHTNFGVACTTGINGQNYSYATVSGGHNNTASGYYATVGGGGVNVASVWSVVSGGVSNTASGSAATVGGGAYNIADSSYTTVGGGYDNTASGDYATVGGGSENTVSNYWTTVGGGYNNTASGSHATIAGGRHNFIEGDYSAVCGGYADTITATADYSYLFGINSKLTQGSTFMVDMPHIRFGDETNGYEFPTADGFADQVMVTDGSGQMSWGNGSSFGSWSVTDSVLYTNNYWGIARGGADNVLYGSNVHTHTNFGNACTTGISGQNNSYITVSGGNNNTASGSYATIGGGDNNTASVAATVGGGGANIASAGYATVGGGYDNTASSLFATVGGGQADTAAANYSFATNYSTYVLSGHTNSAAFTTSHTTAANQVIAANYAYGTMMLTMDHPSDPMNKILNQHTVGSSEAILVYNGTAYIDKNGRVEVVLPDYFDKINKNPRIQLTGVGTSDVYVAEKVRENKFIIGGKPDTEVYWTVTGERTDIHAEIARIQTPVEQQKTGDLIGHSHDDDALIGIYDRLQKEKPGYFAFKTEEGRRVHEQSKKIVESKE